MYQHSIQQNRKIHDDQLTILIAAYNEEMSIVETIKSIEQFNSKLHVVVIDDGSTDRTTTLIEDYQKQTNFDLRLIKHKVNKGYGACLKTGYNAVETEYILFFDADGQHDANDIGRLVDAIKDNDMVIGVREKGKDGIPFIRKPGKWLLWKLANYLSETKIPDLNSGLRILKRALLLKYDHILPTGFSLTTTITLAALQDNCNIEYLPIKVKYRVGKSTVSYKDAYRSFLFILRVITLFNPLKVYLPLSAFFFIIALISGIHDILQGNFGDTTLLGFLGGVLLFMIGILSDQLANLQKRI